MSKIVTTLLVMVSILSAQMLQESMDVNSLNEYHFQSQHDDATLTISNNVQTIIVSFDKDSGAMVNEFLNEQDKSYLNNHNAVFIADISKMPSIITTLFAMPKMKKYKHTIFLHNDGKLESFVPAQEDKLTIVKVENAKVSNISYITSLEELKAQFN